MGAVYQAWDAELAVAVAIKVILPEATADPEAARDLERRFKRELVLARQVTHRNVVRIHDLGEIDGIKYITMPFVNGQDLDSILKQQGRLPVPKALGIMKQVVAGLEAAHQAGVVHRDLKPANVMIEDEQVLVMDFGIARSVSGATMATVAGSVMGTLDYMAPEQARGEPVDQRADVYALGLMFYDLLLGRRPAVTDNPVNDLMARMKAAPPSARTIDPQVPEALDAIISKCLQPDPAARYQTSAELAAALEGLDADGHPLRGAARREWHLTLAAGVTALVLLAAGGAWWAGRRTAAPSSAATHTPVSILIADFANQTGDPVFEGSLEQALALSVEGASFIDAYPRQTALGLVSQISPGRRLNEDGARLVSVREGIKVVLAGSIATAGSGYVVAVKAIDPSEGKTISTADAEAADKGQVLEAVQKVATRIRRELGDSSPESGQVGARETFTAATLEAARAYAQAQDVAATGNDEEAISHYKDAIGHDDKFGRAYAGWAVSAFRLGRRDEAEEQWKKALSLMDRMTEREKYRTLGTYYLGITRNYEKAVENYEALVKAYPGDGSGLNNLGVAYFDVLNLPKAVEQGKRAVQIYPRNATYRTNLALYQMYSSDFASAVSEALLVIKDRPTHKAYLPMAMAALADRKPDAARGVYDSMAKVSAAGASLAAMGQADISMVNGQYAEAQDILKRGMASDDAAKFPGPRAVKQVAFAETEEALGHKSGALAAARDALKARKSDAIVVPAARLLLRAGEDREAAALASGLDQQLLKQSRAYAKLIEAQIALARGRRVEAIDALTAAKSLADLWLVRFELGRAYVENGAYAEALSELDLCVKRRGEATAVFLDDVPSFRYLVPLSYWLARAQEGTGQKEAAAANYKAYLALRESVPGDPLAADARKRLGT